MGGRGGSSHMAAAIGGGGTGVPRSLEKFVAYEQKWLNDKFAQYFTPEQLRYMQGQLKKVFQRNDFGMDIQSNYLENVIAEGFKNQFQTHSSNGSLDFSARKTVAENLFGLDAGKLQAADFERYGYLVTSDVHAHNSSGYGDVTVRFKKENLLSRTTYTIDDSLGPGLYGDLIAGSVERGSVTGIIIPTNPGKAKDLYAAFQQAESLIDNPGKWAQKIENYSSYLELQYHGSLTIGDVASMNFKSDMPSLSLYNQLKQHNITVYYQGQSEEHWKHLLR